MRKHKLRRSRRSVFGRKRMPTSLKTTLWILICVAVVAVGYLGAMIASQGGLPQLSTKEPQVDAPVASPSTPEETTPTDAPTNEDTTPTDKPTDEEPPVNSDVIRAFYLPASALSIDSLSETSLFADAAAAGFNAVVFDLKDAEGTLYYQFTNPQAKKADTYAENALSAEQLTVLFQMMEQYDLAPIPRLHAFRDHLAAKTLADARVMVESNHSWSWHDADPNDGGRRWLNPYAEAAHNYIGALAEELKNAGAAAVMLDSVQFPSQTSSAYFGEDAATISKSDILTTFVSKMRTLLGDDCPLLLGCTAESALGNATQVYGGNPLTFSPSVAVPSVTKDVKETVEKILFRIEGPDVNDTALTPMLTVTDLSAKNVNATIAACVEGGSSGFILYAADGSYDFSAYDLP